MIETPPASLTTTDTHIYFEFWLINLKCSISAKIHLLKEDINYTEVDNTGKEMFVSIGLLYKAPVKPYPEYCVQPSSPRGKKN